MVSATCSGPWCARPLAGREGIGFRCWCQPALLDQRGKQPRLLWLSGLALTPATACDPTLACLFDFVNSCPLAYDRRAIRMRAPGARTAVRAGQRFRCTTLLQAAWHGSETATGEREIGRASSAVAAGGQAGGLPGGCLLPCMRCCSAPLPRSSLPHCSCSFPHPSPLPHPCLFSGAITMPRAAETPPM